MKEHLNDKLKILQFCDNFYPQIDGVVKVVDNSTRVMNERYSAKVVVPKYKGKTFDDSIFLMKFYAVKQALLLLTE